VPNSFDTVRRQIEAMGSEAFEVGLFNPEAQGEPMMMPRTWDADSVLRSVPWMRLQNRGGRNIYIRPRGEHSLSLVDDLTGDAVALMKRTGFSPALVVRTSPGNHQVWLKHPARLDRELGTVVARALAEKFGGDRGAADWRHFGRLAGFVNVYSRTHKTFALRTRTTRATMRRRHIRRRNLAMNATFHSSPQWVGPESAQVALHAAYVGASEFPVQVIQTNGLPEIALTCYANELLGILSPSSVRG
jgi:hypothetical protein